MTPLSWVPQPKTVRITNEPSHKPTRSIALLFLGDQSLTGIARILPCGHIYPLDETSSFERVYVPTGDYYDDDDTYNNDTQA